MKKLLIAIDNLGGGGAEKVLITLLNNLDTNKFSVTLLLLFNEGVYLNEVPPHVKINYLFNPKSTLIRKTIYKLFKYSPAEKIYKNFIKETYDVEIAFLEGSTTKLISGSTNPNSQKIAWVHTDFSNYHWTVHYYKNNEEERLQYKSFNEIVFVSDDARKGFENTLHLKKNLNVIYNPINTEEIIEKSKEEEITFDNLTVISVGRLIPQKGFDRLIKAHANLLKAGIKHHVVILGEGEERERLEQLCRDLNVESSVKFLGFQTNPYKYINAADIFVSSSRVEGLSLVVAEALILEKPVISTRCSGPIELLDNGKYGLIVENTGDALYDGLSFLLINNDERKKYELLAKQRKSFFDIQKVMEQIHELIDN
jgi:glycosyltransferase involved in cell wall biosynthesis